MCDRHWRILGCVTDIQRILGWRILGCVTVVVNFGRDLSGVQKILSLGYPVRILYKCPGQLRLRTQDPVRLSPPGHTPILLLELATPSYCPKICPKGYLTKFKGQQKPKSKFSNE